MAESPGQQGPAPSQQTWARTTMWVGIVLILAASGVYVFKSCRDAPVDLIAKAGKAMSDVASAFKGGTIKTSFTSYATTISNQHFLQFATLKQTEIFTREQPGTVFGYPVLPDIVVEARAPVEFTYYLDLNGKWEFQLRDNVLNVFPPPIKWNKPAVDASAITYQVKKGYVKTAEAQENLKQSITGLVTLRARENVPLVKENGRRQTAEFVEKWLMKSFTDGKQFPVKVYFPDEPRPGAITIPSRPSN